MTNNHEERKTPYLAALQTGDKEKIFSSALDVLERTGIIVHDEKTLKILGSAGAQINGDRAYIPSGLVERALKSAPKEIKIFTRDGAPAMTLSGSNCYFGNGTDCPKILDPFSGERRMFLKKDIENAAILCDALLNFDFVMPTGVASDMPSATSDMHQFHAMMMNTHKPIIFTAYSSENHQSIIQMAQIAAGGEKELREKPFVISYPEPISPLTFNIEVCEKLRFCAENLVPVICTTAPISGASGPVTAEGNMILCLAEGLASIVIAQLINEGAPMITIGIPIILNMKTGAISFDAPELQLMSAGLLDLREFIKLPTWGMAAATDSKLPDEQAAITAAVSCVFQSLSRANLIHGIGCIESGMTTSFDLIVMTNEIIGMLRRILPGVNTDAEHLAVDVIREVGPGGEYLSHNHTLENYRELWDSGLIDRGNYETWINNGGKTLGQRAHEKVLYILNNHKPKPLSLEKTKAIAEILKKIDTNL